MYFNCFLIKHISLLEAVLIKIWIINYVVCNKPWDRHSCMVMHRIAQYFCTHVYIMKPVANSSSEIRSSQTGVFVNQLLQLEIQDNSLFQLDVNDLLMMC